MGFTAFLLVQIFRAGAWPLRFPLYKLRKKARIRKQNIRMATNPDALTTIKYFSDLIKDSRALFRVKYPWLTDLIAIFCTLTGYNRHNTPIKHKTIINIINPIFFILPPNSN